MVEDFVSEPAFDLLTPTPIRAPFLFDAPHSGRAYPAAFLAESRLDAHAIRASEDAHVDALVRSCVDRGMPLLRARFPRAFLDVNREPLELDPRMFDGRLPVDANTRSPRVTGGLGTIPRLVSESDEIYRGRIPVAEALGRIEGIYRPYHETLRRTLGEIHGRFGVAVLIDCHSMPSVQRMTETGGRPDVVLGDRHGTSCHPGLIDVVSALLRTAGYRVARNKPYAGGFITEHYGRPAKGLHALQIEIARGLYMDETTLEPNGGFSLLQRDLDRLIGELAGNWGLILAGDAQAAE
nr:N-formylglutamate amidohydrolase [Siculibacillus lacustris]